MRAEARGRFRTALDLDLDTTLEPVREPARGPEISTAILLNHEELPEKTDQKAARAVGSDEWVVRLSLVSPAFLVYMV